MVKVKKLTKSKLADTPDFWKTDKEMQRDHEAPQRPVNISETERWAVGIGGGLLALYGISKRGLGGTIMALFGGSLIYRGVSGHCEVYKALGINTSPNDRPNVSVRHGEGHKVEKSIIINKSPEELYSFWRDFENLPQFMSQLESVNVLDNTLSHWKTKTIMGKTVEWDAEIINEKENEMIAWRSLEGEVPNAGSVHFEKAAGNRGTQVRVVFSYEPPGGIIGTAIAKIFGESPEHQLEEDLRRFKQLVEVGETISTEGQPSGRMAKSVAK